MDFTVSHTVRPYPHDTACQGCRDEHRCDVCGREARPWCTNGRCMECHAEVCTGGGDERKHGYGTTARAIRAAMKRAVSR